jgi:hypothetical protein
MAPRHHPQGSRQGPWEVPRDDDDPRRAICRGADQGRSIAMRGARCLDAWNQAKAPRRSAGLSCAGADKEDKLVARAP